MTRIHVIVPDDVLTEVDARSGKRGRSEMITNALRRVLQWEKQEEALRRGVGAWRAEDHEDIVTYEQMVAWVRRERADWSRRAAEERGPYS